jgi:hypothetical protein
MLQAFAQKGMEIVGLDSSKDAIIFARKRIAGIKNATAILGDMTNFDLKRVFDGAICPINTLAILTPRQLAQHLDCMGRHLRTDARYFVQVAIRKSGKLNEDDGNKGFEWSARRGDISLRIRVKVDHVDYENMKELHSFQIIVDEGARAGEIIEEKHWMTRWISESWAEAINASQFIQHGQYDGDDLNFSLVKIGSPGNLMWHELLRR